MTTTDSAQEPGRSAGVPGEWLDSHLATIFSRWHPFVIQCQAETIDHVIRAAGVQPGFDVLDVGCGSGVPALTLAKLVGPSGKVVATDPSPTFLAAARQNAQDLGLTNLETVQSSAASLPFPPSSFDAVTCHMGVMFFSDIRAGLTRIREVLRPGRRAGFVAWGPDEDNVFFGTFRAVVRNYIPAPEQTDPEPVSEDVPRPSRFAKSGSLSSELETAGFGDVQESAPMVELVWPGTSESLVDFWMELSRIGDQIPAARLESFKIEAGDAFSRFSDGSVSRFPGRVVVASGQA